MIRFYIASVLATITVSVIVSTVLVLVDGCSFKDWRELVSSVLMWSVIPIINIAICGCMIVAFTQDPIDLWRGCS